MEHKIFLFGLYNAGKTSISETIRSGKTILFKKPSLAINFNKWIIQDKTFQVWDVPGQHTLRNLWQKSVHRSEILVFVLDTADPERYEEAFTEFHNIIDDPDNKGMPLVFCFHKIDLPEARTFFNDTVEKFNLDSLKDRKTYTLKTSVKQLESIEELKKLLVTII